MKSFQVKIKGEAGMNKYFSKALFYMEKTNRNLSMSAYSVLYLWGILDMLNKLRIVKGDPAYGPPHSADFFSNNFQLFLYICIASIVYSYLEKDKKYYFMLTQGYSRDSIMITKTVSFITSYLIPTVVYGMASFIILILNKKYYFYYNQYIGDVYSRTMTELFMCILAIIAILTFVTVIVQFLEMSFGKISAVVILSLVLWFMLYFGFNIMRGFLSKKLGILRDYLQLAIDILFGQGRGALTIESNSIEYIPLTEQTWMYFQTFNVLISVALILLSLIIFYINVKLNQKVKAENTSNVFMFKFSERIFKTVASFFITVVGSLALFALVYYAISFFLGSNYSTVLINKYGLGGKENIEQTIYLVLNILWIPLCVFIYKIVGKILNKRGTLQC